MGARVLKKSFHIGVTTHPQPDLSSPYFSACVDGLLAVFNQSDLSFNPHGSKIDGWVLLAPNSAQVDEIRRIGQPAVIVNGSADDLPCIDLDNLGAAREITAYLVGQGHRRIGFIAGKSEMANAQDRLEGYRQGLAENGIPWDPSLIIEGRFERAGGQNAMNQFIRMTPSPTAIFAANDHMALGAWDVLTERKILVPKHMSLVGFDDIPEAELAGLTSFHQPLTDMARQAGVLLFTWMRTGRPGTKGIHFVSGELRKRNSSGPTVK